MIGRRGFLGGIAAAVTGAVFDPELELFVPGKRVYSIPARTGPTGLEVEVVYSSTFDGIQEYSFKGRWTNPAQEDFKGVRVLHKHPGESFYRILAVESEGSDSFQTDTWPLPEATETPTIYTVPFDHTNRSESLSLSTPKVSLAVKGDPVSAQRARALWETEHRLRMEAALYHLDAMSMQRDPRR